MDSSQKRSKKVRGVLQYPDGVVHPEDFLRFIQLGSFESDWKRLQLDDEDLQALEVLIMIGPDLSPIVSGTGGLRKVRFASRKSGKGKSGGCRVGYVFFPDWSVVTLILAYSKQEATDLSPQQKRAIKALIEDITARLAKGA